MHLHLRTAAVLSVFVLAGCASHGQRSVAAPAAAPPASTQSFVVDDAYVSRVNQKAQRRGLHVQWVNPPVRRTRKD